MGLMLSEAGWVRHQEKKASSRLASYSSHSFAMKKHRDQGNLWRKEFALGYSPRRLAVYPGGEGITASSSHGNRSRKVRDLFNHKAEAGRTNWKWV